MLYTQSALSVDAQIELLRARNLEADDDALRRSLTNVSYHRLSGYWHPYREYGLDGDDWRFREGTDFADIWDRYVFDRQLRLLALDAIERVEVALRNDLILNVAVSQGPFGYQDPSTLPNIAVVGSDGSVLYSHDTLLGNIRAVYRRELKAENPTIVAFDAKYPGNGEYLPYWIMLEVVDFGTLGHIIHGLPTKTKSLLARRYGLRRHTILASWVEILRINRNRCSHHSRLWNRRNINKPEIPNAKNPEWHTPVEVGSVADRTFAVLTILKYLMGYIAPQSAWADRLEALFARHPNIDRRLLGYPDNWRECPIWSAGWLPEVG